MSEELYKEMAQCIIDGDSDKSVELAQKAIELKMHPLDAITKGFVVGVNYIGDQFGKGEAFLPELVMAGEAMKVLYSHGDDDLARVFVGELEDGSSGPCSRLKPITAQPPASASPLAMPST